jgi:hypothetical protein
VDRYYGGGASERMSWRAWHAARQLLAEEAIGSAMRASGAHEDSEFTRSAEVLRRQK